MRVVMLGTGGFAVPTLRRLVSAGHQIPLVVTRPTRPASGRTTAPPSPMRAAAEELSIPVLAPQTVNSDEAREQLRVLEPELLVVCDYGEILRPETLLVAAYGGINLHASLLPKYRGAAPINWAIYYGDAETGNTVIHMTPRLDAGPALAQERTPIRPDETAVELEARLAESGAELVLRVVGDLAAGRAEPLPQDGAQATKAPRLRKSDGEIQWDRTAREIYNQFRAFQPWPQLYTFWRRPGHEPLRLIVHALEVIAPSDQALLGGPTAATDIPAAGTVLAANDKQGDLIVATNAGALRLLSVQPAGKRIMSAAEFLRGHPLSPGTRLG